MKYIQKTKTLALVGLTSLPFFVSADSKIDNPLQGNDNLISFLNTIIDALLQLGAVLAVVAVIYAGFMFVTAQGDEKKITTAKNIFLYTIIGLAILLGARIISEVITNTINNVRSDI